MKIIETHANGSSIEVSGRGARAAVEEWRKAQQPKVEPEEAPRFTTGQVTTQIQTRVDGGVEKWTEGYKSPIIFGFVPNEVNR